MPFPPLTDWQIRDLEQVFGRPLRPDELKLYNAHHSDDGGFFKMDSQPRGNRKFLLLYSACWAIGMRQYLEKYRRELFQDYWVMSIIDYGLILSVQVFKHFPMPDIVAKVWGAADVVLFSPTGSFYGELGTDHLLRFCKPGCTLVSFTGPKVGHIWSICPLLGEHGVLALFNQGLTKQQVWEKYLDGSFDPLFPIREAENRGYQNAKKSITDVPLDAFFQKHFRNCRLFHTFNHPTYPFLAYTADQCMAKLGYPAKSDEEILAIPEHELPHGEIYPDDHYAWDYYKFTYPPSYSEMSGGKEFYRIAIERCWEQWLKTRALA